MFHSVGFTHRIVRDVIKETSLPVLQETSCRHRLICVMHKTETVMNRNYTVSLSWALWK